jgi:hypothetical protein
MPEDPTPPIEPAANPDQAAEWTDESGYEDIESTADLEGSTVEATPDEWEATELDWEEDLADPMHEPAAPTTQEALAWLKPTWQKFQASWLRLVAGLRNRIPAAAKLSDAAISAILIGILGLLLVLLNTARQPSVAVERSPQAAPKPVVEVPAPQPLVPNTTTPATEPISAAPSAPHEGVDIERIAKIQAQLTDSSIYNASRVVDSVQADFTQNRLTLICNEDWFRLSHYDQKLLANQLMNQSKDLSFKDLELQSPDGTLIARNPIIGDEMIIFLREKPPAVEPPERPRYRITVDR